MTVQRVSMHKIKEVLRLKYAAGLKQRQIAAALGLSHGVVAKYLSAAERAHLAYPWPAEWDDTHLAQALFGATYQPAPVKRLTLDFTYIHQELKRKGVTRLLLWEEYAAAHPATVTATRSSACSTANGVGASSSRCAKCIAPVRSCSSITAARPSPSSIRRPAKSESAQVFVAVIGASNYTFAEATWSQSLADWIGSHYSRLRLLRRCPATRHPRQPQSGGHESLPL